MNGVPEQVIKAVRQGNQLAVKKYAKSGGHARARQVALQRAEEQRQTDLALDQRIQRLKDLVRTPWVIVDAHFAALRSGYDALAD